MGSAATFPDLTSNYQETVRNKLKKHFLIICPQNEGTNLSFLLAFAQKATKKFNSCDIQELVEDESVLSQLKSLLRNGESFIPQANFYFKRYLRVQVIPLCDIANRPEQFERLLEDDNVVLIAASGTSTVNETNYRLIISEREALGSHETFILTLLERLKENPALVSHFQNILESSENLNNAFLTLKGQIEDQSILNNEAILNLGRGEIQKLLRDYVTTNSEFGKDVESLLESVFLKALQSTVDNVIKIREAQHNHSIQGQLDSLKEIVKNCQNLYKLIEFQPSQTFLSRADIILKEAKEFLNENKNKNYGKIWKIFGENNPPKLVNHETETFFKIVDLLIQKLLPKADPITGGNGLSIAAASLSMQAVVRLVETRKRQENECQLERVVITAPTLVLFDCDLHQKLFHSLDVIIEARKITFLGDERIINVTGENGKNAENTFQALKHSGRSGSPGANGNPGESGGNVDINCKFYSCSQGFILRIITNGGKGSDGCHGQDGTPGDDGTIGGEGQPVRPCAPLWYNVEKGTVGSDGENGGNGGDGGMPGGGGEPGIVVLGKGLEGLTREVSGEKGDDGKPGEPGKGASGGSAGENGIEKWRFWEANKRFLWDLRSPITIGNWEKTQPGQLQLKAVYNGLTNKVSKWFGKGRGHLRGYDWKHLVVMPETIVKYEKGCKGNPGTKHTTVVKAKQKQRKRLAIEKQKRQFRNIDISELTLLRDERAQLSVKNKKTETLRKTTALQQLQHCYNRCGKFLNKGRKETRTAIHLANPQINLDSSQSFQQNFKNLLSQMQPEQTSELLQSLYHVQLKLVPETGKAIRKEIFTPLMKILSEMKDVETLLRSYEYHYIISGQLLQDSEFLLGRGPSINDIEDEELIAAFKALQIKGSFSLPKLFFTTRRTQKFFEFTNTSNASVPIFRNLREIMWDKDVFRKVLLTLKPEDKSKTSQTVVKLKEMFDRFVEVFSYPTFSYFDFLKRLRLKDSEANYSYSCQDLLATVGMKLLEKPVTFDATFGNPWSEATATFFMNEFSLKEGVQSKELQFALPYLKVTVQRLEVVQQWSIRNSIGNESLGRCLEEIFTTLMPRNELSEMMENPLLKNLLYTQKEKIIRESTFPRNFPQLLGDTLTWELYRIQNLEKPGDILAAFNNVSCDMITPAFVDGARKIVLPFLQLKEKEVKTMVSLRMKYFHSMPIEPLPTSQWYTQPQVFNAEIELRLLLLTHFDFNFVNDVELQDNDAIESLTRIIGESFPLHVQARMFRQISFSAFNNLAEPLRLPGLMQLSVWTVLQGIYQVLYNIHNVISEADGGAVRQGEFHFVCTEILEFCTLLLMTKWVFKEDLPTAEERLLHQQCDYVMNRIQSLEGKVILFYKARSKLTDLRSAVSLTTFGDVHKRNKFVKNLLWKRVDLAIESFEKRIKESEQFWDNFITPKVEDNPAVVATVFVSETRKFLQNVGIDEGWFKDRVVHLDDKNFLSEALSVHQACSSYFTNLESFPTLKGKVVVSPFFSSRYKEKLVETLGLKVLQHYHNFKQNASRFLSKPDEDFGQLLATILSNTTQQEPFSPSVLCDIAKLLDKSYPEILKIFNSIPDSVKKIQQSFLSVLTTKVHGNLVNCTPEFILEQGYNQDGKFWWDVVVAFASQVIGIDQEHFKVFVEALDVKTFRAECEEMTFLKFLIERLALHTMRVDEIPAFLDICCSAMAHSGGTAKLHSDLSSKPTCSFLKGIGKIGYIVYLEKYGHSELLKDQTEIFTALLSILEGKSETTLIHQLVQKVADEISPLTSFSKLHLPPDKFSKIVIKLGDIYSSDDNNNKDKVLQDLLSNPVIRWLSVLEKYEFLTKWKCTEEMATKIEILYTTYEKGLVDNFLTAFETHVGIRDEAFLKEIEKLVSPDGSLQFTSGNLSSSLLEIERKRPFIVTTNGTIYGNTASPVCLSIFQKNLTSDHRSLEKYSLEEILNFLPSVKKNEDILEHYLEKGELKKRFEEIEQHTNSNLLTTVVAVQDYLREKLPQDNAALPYVENNLTEILSIVFQAVELSVKRKDGAPLKLRPNQKLAAILFAEYTFLRKRSLIGEIPTAEGKSVIGAVNAVVMALAGMSSVVITSNKVLPDETLGQVEGLYSLFNIRVGLTTRKDLAFNLEKRREMYRVSQVVYTDLQSLQRDFLLSRTLKMDIFCGFKPVKLIIDEVDCLLLDGADSVFYLGNQIPDLASLLPIYIHIWAEIQSQSRENDEANVTAKIQEILETNQLSIPTHLKDFIKLGISVWVKCCQDSLNLEEGDEFVISGRKCDRPRIMIMDKSVGTEQPDMNWTHCHQFLQICNGEQLTIPTWKADFISNLGFIKPYENHVLGLTGALGSEHEKEILRIFYKVHFFAIPRHTKRKLIIEEPIIIRGSSEDHLNAITNITNEIIQTGKSVVHLCPNVSTTLKLSAKAAAIIPNENKIVTYTSAFQDHIFDQELKSVGTNTVITATYVAGRGTDFGITDELREMGGLDLIMTELSESERNRIQGEGRVARGPDPGRLRYIIHETEIEGDFQTVRMQKDIINSHNLNDFRLNKFPTMRMEEDLYEKFNQFCDGVEERLKTEEKEYATLQISFLKRSWTFWLESLEIKFPNFSKSSTKVWKEFDSFKKQIEEKLKIPLFQLAESPTELLTLGKLLASKGDYCKAMHTFQKLINDDPAQAEMAYYNQAVLFLEKAPNNTESRRFAIKLFKKSKRLLEIRAKGATANRNVLLKSYVAMQENGKGSPGNGIIMQLEMEAHIWNTLAKSIDSLIGFPLDWDRLMVYSLQLIKAAAKNELLLEEERGLEQNIAIAFQRIESRLSETRHYKRSRINAKLVTNRNNLPFQVSYLYDTFVSNVKERYFDGEEVIDSHQILGELPYKNASQLWDLLTESGSIFETREGTFETISARNGSLPLLFTKIEKETLPSLLKFLFENDGQVFSSSLLSCHQYGISREEMEEMRNALEESGCLENVETRSTNSLPDISNLHPSLEKFRPILKKWNGKCKPYLLSQLQMQLPGEKEQKRILKTFLQNDGIIKRPTLSLPLGDNSEFLKLLEDILHQDVFIQSLGENHLKGRNKAAKILLNLLKTTIGKLKICGKYRPNLIQLHDLFKPSDWLCYQPTFSHFYNLGIDEILEFDDTVYWQETQTFLSCLHYGKNAVMFSLIFALGPIAVPPFLLSLGVDNIFNEYKLQVREGYWHEPGWKWWERFTYNSEAAIMKGLDFLPWFQESSSNAGGQPIGKLEKTLNIISQIVNGGLAAWSVMKFVLIFVDERTVDTMMISLLESRVIKFYVKEAISGTDFMELWGIIEADTGFTDAVVIGCYEDAKRKVLEDAETRNLVQASMDATNQGFQEIMELTRDMKLRRIVENVTSFLEVDDIINGFIDSRNKNRLGLIVEQLSMVGNQIFRRMNRSLKELAKNRPQNYIPLPEEMNLKRMKATFATKVSEDLTAPILSLISPDPEVLEDYGKRVEQNEKVGREMYTEWQNLLLNHQEEVDEQEDNNVENE